MLTRFYLSKSWREQRKPLFIIPLIAFTLAVAVCVTVYYFPAALTGPSLNAVQQGAQASGATGSEKSMLLVGAVISQAPLFAALFACLVGANIAIGIADIEVRSGAIEVVLTRGYRPRDVVGALTFVATLLGLTSTFILVVGFFAASWLALYQLDAAVDLPWRVLVLPWPCLLLGIACGLAIQLLFPNLSRVKAGTSGNIAQLLAILPTIAIFLLFTFSAKAATTASVTWLIAGVFTFVAVALVGFVAASIKVTRLLQQ